RALPEPSYGARDQHIRIIASTIGNLCDYISTSTPEVGQCEIDCSRARALSPGQRVLSDEDAIPAKCHPGRVDTIVHPPTAEPTANYSRAARHAIASARRPQSPNWRIPPDAFAFPLSHNPTTS